MKKTRVKKHLIDSSKWFRLERHKKPGKNNKKILITVDIGELSRVWKLPESTWFTRRQATEKALISMLNVGVIEYPYRYRVRNLKEFEQKLLMFRLTHSV